MKQIQKKLAKNRSEKLSHEEVCSLAKKAQSGCIESRNTLIERNLGLAMKIAGQAAYIQRFNHNIEPEDCFQEAVFGLNRAIELFDTTKGFAFSTYAYWWVKQIVNRYIDNNRHAIRMPIHQVELQRKFYNIQLEHEGQDEEFYINLIAFENNKSPELVKAALSFKVETLKSLDVSVEDNVDEGVYVDTPIDRLEQITFSTDTTHLDAYYIKKIAELLPERDMKVLMLRMDNWSLEAIGEMSGLSKERVRQIEHRALIKLRALVNKVKYREADFYGNEKFSNREEIYKGDAELERHSPNR